METETRKSLARKAATLMGLGLIIASNVTYEPKNIYGPSYLPHETYLTNARQSEKLNLDSAATNLDLSD